MYFIACSQKFTEDIDAKRADFNQMTRTNKGKSFHESQTHIHIFGAAAWLVGIEHSCHENFIILSIDCLHENVKEI